MIRNDQTLQTLLKGDTGESAFEVWVDHQPIKYDQDGTTIIIHIHTMNILVQFQEQ